MKDSRDDPTTAQYWLNSFEEFIDEWRRFVYQDAEWARVRKRTKFVVERNRWCVAASASYRDLVPGFGHRRFPIYRFSAGVILGLHDIFMTLCADPNFFPQIVGEGRDHEGPPLHPDRFRDYKFVGDTTSSPLTHRMPLDEPRLQLALYLMTAGFHWILYHEESHYLAGHLSFQRQMHARETIDEVLLVPIDALENEDLRALESHADERAHIQVFRIYGCEPGMRTHPIEWCRNPLEGLRISIVAIGCVLLLFHANEPPERSTHPASLTRLLDAFTLLFTLLGRKDPTICEREATWVTADATRSLFLAATQDLEIAAQLLGLNSSVPRILSSIFDSSANRTEYLVELEAVKARLAAIRNDLDDCRRKLEIYAWPGAKMDQW